MQGNLKESKIISPQKQLSFTKFYCIKKINNYGVFPKYCKKNIRGIGKLILRKYFIYIYKFGNVFISKIQGVKPLSICPAITKEVVFRYPTDN